MEESLRNQITEQPLETVASVVTKSGTFQVPIVKKVEIVITEGNVFYEVYKLPDAGDSETNNDSLAPPTSVIDDEHDSNTTEQEGSNKIDNGINSNLNTSTSQKSEGLTVKSYHCFKCNTDFTDFNDLKRHQSLEHSLEEFESVQKNGCPICESHIRPKSMHSTFKPFLCGVCERGYTSIKELKKHFTIHVRTNVFFCDMCEETFNSEMLLKAHRKEIHYKDKKYKCNLCDKSFRTLSNLKCHSRVHSEERPHVCQYCERAFKSAAELKSHILIHTNVKPYRCAICGKCFRQSGNYHCHLRMHQNEKPHVCPICNKRFIESSKLRRHMRIHFDEKPYQCPVCKRGFSDNSNMKAHMKTHNKNKKVVYFMLLDEDGTQAREISEEVVKSLTQNNNEIPEISTAEIVTSNLEASNTEIAS